jgi:hypothetical protein
MGDGNTPLSLLCERFFSLKRQHGLAVHLDRVVYDSPRVCVAGCWFPCGDAAASLEGSQQNSVRLGWVSSLPRAGRHIYIIMTSMKNVNTLPPYIRMNGATYKRCRDASHRPVSTASFWTLTVLGLFLAMLMMSHPQDILNLRVSLATFLRLLGY